VAKVGGDSQIAAGERVRLNFEPEQCHLFDSRGNVIGSAP
jgi:hypothetical protein